MKERKTQRNTCSGSVLPQTDQHLAVESFQTQLSCNVCTFLAQEMQFKDFLSLNTPLLRGCVINKSYRKAAPFKRKTFTQSCLPFAEKVIFSVLVHKASGSQTTSHAASSQNVFQPFLWNSYKNKICSTYVLHVELIPVQYGIFVSE